MINFFKNKTLEDYIIYSIITMFLLGMLMFFIGFFWGFKSPIDLGTEINFSKLNVNSVLHGDWNLYGGRLSEPQNLFDLMKNIDSSFDALYALTIVSIIGFSIIMFSIFLVIIVVIFAFTKDFIIPFFQKRKKVNTPNKT